MRLQPVHLRVHSRKPLLNDTIVSLRSMRLARQVLSALPFVVAVILFGGHVYTGVVVIPSYDRRHSQCDSSLAVLWSDRQRERNLLRAGDTLPSVRLTRGTSSMELRQLPAMGYRVLYLYRTNCPQCQVLDPFVRHVPEDSRRHVAFIAFRQNSVNSADFSWPPEVESPAVYGAPTLIAVDTDGRVLSVAHASLDHVAILFNMLGVLQKSELDAVMRLRDLPAGEE